MALPLAMGRMGTRGDSYDGPDSIDTGSQSSGKKPGLMQCGYYIAQRSSILDCPSIEKGTEALKT